MHVGINYPWLNCGWDFGNPPRSWIGGESLKDWQEWKRRSIEEDFANYARLGMFAVRWFILADGTNYGTGESAPRKRGREWSFDPLPEGDPFYDSLLSDFEFALQMCKRNGLILLPSLIDFSWCAPGISISGSDGVVKGGRYEIIREPAKRAVFFDRVLDPLLSVSRKYQGSIYAWELINEPEWVIRKFWNFWILTCRRTVTLQEMREFISEGVQRIHSKSMSNGTRAFHSSVGFAHWKSLRKWKVEELGITLPQFHYYAQRNRRLPKCLELSEHTCLVGEFATASAKSWPDLKMLNREQSITNRLFCIEEKGYPACFMWSARAMDPASRWTAEAQQELFAYNARNSEREMRA